MSRQNTRLLIDEYPLYVLPSLAEAVGLNEAIFVQKLHLWLKSKHAKYIDGRYWVHNTYEEWHKQFPFWSADTVKRVIRAAESADYVLSTKEYNARGGDQTKWYSIDYEALEEMAGCTLEKPEEESDQSAESHDQQGNLHPPNDADCTDQQGNLHRPLPVGAQEAPTESAVEEGRDADPHGDATPVPDDTTARCLLLLKKVKGIGKDYGELALLLAELREEYPGADPVEVCRDYEFKHRHGEKTRNHPNKLRNFFRVADRGVKANGQRTAAAVRSSAGPSEDAKDAAARRRVEGYEDLFDKEAALERGPEEQLQTELPRAHPAARRRWERAFEDLCAFLEAEEERIRPWFEGFVPVTAGEAEDDEIVLVAPREFSARYVEDRYGEVLRGRGVVVLTPEEYAGEQRYPQAEDKSAEVPDG